MREVLPLDTSTGQGVLLVCMAALLMAQGEGWWGLSWQSFGWAEG